MLNVPKTDIYTFVHWHIPTFKFHDNQTETNNKCKIKLSQVQIQDFLPRRGPRGVFVCLGKREWGQSLLGVEGGDLNLLDPLPLPELRTAYSIYYMYMYHMHKFDIIIIILFYWKRDHR